MTKLLHALAAAGTALLAACSGELDAPISPTGTADPYSDEFNAAYAEAIAGDMPDVEYDPDAPKEWPRGEPDAFDGHTEEHPGSLIDKARITLLHGWSVPSTSTPQSIPGLTGFHYAAQRTSYSSLSQFGVLGRCGLPSTNFAACILPSTTTRTIPWYFDHATCSTNATEIQPFKDGAIDAMATLDQNTNWSFPQASSISGALLIIKCASGNDLAIMNAPTDPSKRAVGMFMPTGNLTAFNSPFTATSQHQPYEEVCDGEGFESKFDALYRYNTGTLFINFPLFKSSYKQACAGSEEPGFRRNAMNSLVQHEALHWLGFSHHYDVSNTPTFQNPLYPSAGCSDGDPKPFVGALRAGIVTALNNLDTTGNGASPLTLGFDGLSCYRPFADERHSVSEQNQDARGELPIGLATGYTSNNTYGINTSATHKSCGFGPSGQVCLVPSSPVIHWCFAPYVSDNNFKRDLRIRVLNTDPNFANLPAPAGPKPHLGFTVWVEHTSCDDPEVELVIDNNACPGTGSSNVDGYLCINNVYTGPENELALKNNSQWSFAGHFYDWGAVGSWMRISIDTADLAANVPSANRTDAFEHLATLAGFWAIGIGTRTDVTNYFSSRAMVPYKKIAHTGGYRLSPGERCRVSTWRANSPVSSDLGEYRLLESYCGSD